MAGGQPPGDGGDEEGEGEQRDEEGAAKAGPDGGHVREEGESGVAVERFRCELGPASGWLGDFPSDVGTKLGVGRPPDAGGVAAATEWRGRGGGEAVEGVPVGGISGVGVDAAERERGVVVVEGGGVGDVDGGVLGGVEDEVAGDPHGAEHAKGEGDEERECGEGMGQAARGAKGRGGNRRGESDGGDQRSDGQQEEAGGGEGEGGAGGAGGGHPAGEGDGLEGGAQGEQGQPGRQQARDDTAR